MPELSGAQTDMAWMAITLLKEGTQRGKNEWSLEASVIIGADGFR
jgi:hypothetical protein